MLSSRAFRPVLALVFLSSVVVACSDGGGSSSSSPAVDGGKRPLLNGDAASPSPSPSSPAPGAAPPATGACHSLAQSTKPSAACSDPNAGTQTTSLTVRNDCEAPLEMFWVDYDCKEISYGLVEKAAERKQDSYAGHPWRLRIAGSGELVKEIAPLASAPLTVVVP